MGHGVYWVPQIVKTDLHVTFLNEEDKINASNIVTVNASSMPYDCFANRCRDAAVREKYRNKHISNLDDATAHTLKTD